MSESSTARTLVLAAAFTLGGAAWADRWDVAYEFRPDIASGSGGCYLTLERYVERQARGVFLMVDQRTVTSRQHYGHSDPYQPILTIFGNPMKGQKREAEEPVSRLPIILSVQTYVNSTYTGSRIVESGMEYRIRYRVDDGPARDA